MRADLDDLVRRYAVVVAQIEGMRRDADRARRVSGQLELIVAEQADIRTDLEASRLADRLERSEFERAARRLTAAQRYLRKHMAALLAVAAFCGFGFGVTAAVSIVRVIHSHPVV